MGEKLNDEGENIRLWNKNFFLLWQGQLVSMLGDILYMIALDFWILDITGSTGLMGLLSALTMLPRIVLGPFAGVFVDKWNRRNIIVLTDFIRGIVITFVGIAGIFGFIQVWMVFIVGIISGLCSAFFGPAVNSIKPELVHESKFVKANSVTSLATSGMDMIGSAIGGVIYVAIGAPYMFLANGISYLISAFTEIFITEPKREKKTEKITFVEDFKEGFRFIWNFKTLRNLFLLASLLNLFVNAAFILILPYFKSMPFLGPEKYGLFMASIPMGMLVGSALLSIISIKKNQKFKIYKFGALICLGILPFVVIVENFYVMIPIAFISFLFNVIFNTIFNSAIMLVVPSDKRGKIGALMNTISGGLQPIGTLVGGILGEFMPIRAAILSLLGITFIFAIALVSVRGSKALMEYESSDGTVEELIEKTNGIALES
ncbi:MFS transporter [uncultured Clostridium sp.]|uniref:MFS transporter n=1 Tax=uncultured Clostridium sp. TaxID=59620 RepID=UPI00321782C4